MAASLARFNAPARSHEGHAVTILRTGGGRFLATKTFVGRSDGSVHAVPYRAGKYFTPEMVPVSSADELFGLIARLEQDPHAFIVGGRPKAGRRGRIRRTMGEHGDLEDAPRQAVEADVDGLPLPDGMSAVSDPERAVRHALALMGEPWADADCFWQLSASAGMPGNEGVLRARLWFWLDRPMASGALKTALRGVNTKLGGGLRKPVIDWRLAIPNHVHYVAAPRFVCMVDPVAKRSGTVRNGGALRTSLLPKASTPATIGGTVRRAAPTVRNVAPAAGNVTNLVTHTARAKGIRGDILKLAGHLFGGPVPDGFRNDYMLCYAMAAAVESPSNFWELVREGAAALVPGKSEEWLRSKLCSVAERVNRHLAGERVAFAGRLRSPIYTPSIRWYCEYLGLDRITIREAGLTVLVDEATRVRNLRAAKGVTGRRAEGNRRSLGQVMAAEELLGATLGRTPTDGEIAALTGMGKTTVNRIRNRDLSGWGSRMEPETPCQQLRNLSDSVDPDRDMGYQEGKQGISETILGEPEGNPRACTGKVQAVDPTPTAVRIVPEVVRFPCGSPANGLWSSLPIHRPPDTRRRRQVAPAPVSDEHRGMSDFWESSFEDWCEAYGT